MMHSHSSELEGGSWVPRASRMSVSTENSQLSAPPAQHTAPMSVDGSSGAASSSSSSASLASSSFSYPSSALSAVRTATTKVAAPRKTGDERYTYEQDRTKRLCWANRQIKAITSDIMRLEMTTGTISNYCALPETGNATQYSSGNRTYGESVLAFANIVKYMQQGAVPEVHFSVEDVYDRLTHRGGIRSGRAPTAFPRSCHNCSRGPSLLHAIDFELHH